MLRAPAVGVLTIVLAIASSSALTASADVAPYGWHPPRAPEDSHVQVLRRALSEWMDDDEQAELDARHHPSCRPRRGFGSVGYGSPCPDVRRSREIAIDRAVRFFAAATLEARGRPEEARALRDLPPMTSASVRRDAAARLADDPVLGPARRLALDGERWSLEQIALELGRAIRAAVDAGAPRERMVSASLEMLAQLARPSFVITARAEATEGSREEQRLAQVVAQAVRECLEPESEARWRPVVLRVALAGTPARAVLAPSAPARRCVEGAAARAARGRSLDRPLVFRVVVGPGGDVWGEPLELGAD